MKIKYLLSLILCFDAFASSETVVSSITNGPTDLGVVPFIQYYKFLETGELRFPTDKNSPISIDNDINYRGRVSYVNYDGKDVLRRFEILKGVVFTELEEYDAISGDDREKLPISKRIQCLQEINKKVREEIKVPFFVTVKNSEIDLDELADSGITIKMGTGTSPEFKASVAPELARLLPASLIESAIKSKITQTCSIRSGVRLKPKVDTSSLLIAEDICKPIYRVCRLFKVPYVTFKSPLLEEDNRLGGSIFAREFNYRDNIDQWVLLSTPMGGLVAELVSYYNVWSGLLEKCGKNPATVFTKEQLLKLALGLFAAVISMPDTYGLVLAAYKCANILPPNYYKVALPREFEILASLLKKLNDLTKHYNEDDLLKWVLVMNKKFNEKCKEVFESFSISYSLFEGDICSSPSEKIWEMAPEIINTAFSFGVCKLEDNGCLTTKGSFSLAQIAQLHEHLTASSHVFLFTDKTAPDPSKSYWQLKDGVSKTDFYSSFVLELIDKNYRIISIKKDKSYSRSSSEPVQNLVVDIEPNTSFCKNTVDSMYYCCQGRDGASHQQANAIRLVFAISSDESKGEPFSRVNATTIYPILASQTASSSSSSSSGSSSSKP